MAGDLVLRGQRDEEATATRARDLGQNYGDHQAGQCLAPPSTWGREPGG